MGRSTDVHQHAWSVRRTDHSQKKESLRVEYLFSIHCIRVNSQMWQRPRIFCVISGHFRFSLHFLAEIVPPQRHSRHTRQPKYNPQPTSQQHSPELFAFCICTMEHEIDPPVAILIDAAAAGPLTRQGSIRARETDTISNFLFELVRNGCSCGSLLETGCGRTVAYCRDYPDQVFYKAPRTGRTPLHEACLRNACRHVINALLAANPVAAMEQDRAGNTPLHLLFVDFSSYLAISPDEVDETVSDLLAVNPKAIASAINGDGSSALHMACMAPESMIRTSMLMRLITANPVCATCLNSICQTPLSLYCSRRQASVDVAQVLLQAHPRAAMLLDYSGWTPLHHAAHATNTNLIKFLVECAPEAASIRTRPQGRTALHLLCQQVPRDVHLPAIEALLRAAPESATMPDNDHYMNPVHVVCCGARQRLSVIRMITETNPRAAATADVDGYTPLHHACKREADVEIIQYLLSMYCAAASVVTRKHDTPLHIACTANASAETVRSLIEANKDALTKKNDYGYTPLHCVCRAFQPRVGIVQALLEACPESVTLLTHGGETPVHLACSSGAFVSVLDILTKHTPKNEVPLGTGSERLLSARPRMTNKVGNTPLHEACFRGASFEHIETLAKANPEWIVVRNNAGYTPLQIVCKGGRLDDRIVNTFSRIRGPEVFSVVDSHGHTPLHSACREGSHISAIQSLIQAYPEALHSKTSYGDTPLHLSIFRGAAVDIVCMVAEASSDGSLSPVLKPNASGQTPLRIAMDEFQSVCKGTGFCCAMGTFRSEQQRSFDVLKALVKLVYYGTFQDVLSDETPTSLVKACVALHRRDIRLDPAFIRRAIHLYPEEVRMIDEEGNYPLHIEASIPIEKMSLLDSSFRGCCEGKCHSRMGVLGMLLESFPEATQTRNSEGEFPLGLMIRNGRLWDRDFALAVRKFPPALHWYKGMDDKLLHRIMALVSKDCGTETLYELINSRPDAARRR